MERVEVPLDDDLAGELASYARDQHLAEDAAAEQLLSEALAEWRRDRAVERFADGDLTFDRAAELAELDPWAFADLLREREVTWVDSERVVAELDG
ncbi:MULTISPECIES: UPF0175 family protein [unclassified Haloparvum]|uniref:UPF0175 family protein n=1 Tax=Haloparvum sp. PAK95 TaxID=3418962 RepID=UPI003D2F31B6